MCGSGLVDAVAELVHSGLLDPFRGDSSPTTTPLEHPPPGLATRLTKIGEERVVRSALGAATIPRNRCFPVSARCGASFSSPKALDRRTGWSNLAPRAGRRGRGDHAGAASRGAFGAYLSAAQRPVPDRPRGRSSRCRGSCPPANVAGRGARRDRRRLVAGGESAPRARSILDETEYVGELLGPQRLQRPVSSTTAGIFLDEDDSRSSRAGHSRRRRPGGSAAAAGGIFTSTRCRRCSTNRARADSRRRRSLESWRRLQSPVTTRWPSPTVIAEPTGALDELGVDRIDADQCYGMVGPRSGRRLALAEQPGTYFLTDFLARTFRAKPWGAAKLGLDRSHPEAAAPTTSGATRACLWLAQQRPDALRRAGSGRARCGAGSASRLTFVEVGRRGELEHPARAADRRDGLLTRWAPPSMVGPAAVGRGAAPRLAAPRERPFFRHAPVAGRDCVPDTGPPSDPFSGHAF